MPCRAGIALTALVLTGASVRAEMLQWGYNWEPSAAQIATDGGGSGHLTLTNEPVKTATNSSNTVITNLRSVSTADSATPDTFAHAAFSFTLRLQDLASQAIGTLTVSGFFSGTITAESANVMANFTSPAVQTLSLGGNTYTVTLGSYSPPGPPGAINSGSLNAVVSVLAGDGGGHTGGNPPGDGGGHTGGTAAEPSTLILASLAFPYFGVAGWRRRKKGTQTPPAA
jgi:hypothetical protein